MEPAHGQREGGFSGPPQAHALVIAAFAVALLPAPLAVAQTAAGTQCPTGTFWEPDELPDVHQLNFVASQAEFDEMRAQQMDYSRVVTGDLTFNDARYAGVELQVHGGVCVQISLLPSTSTVPSTAPSDTDIPELTTSHPFVQIPATSSLETVIPPQVAVRGSVR